MVSATETIGDTSALCAGALKRQPTDKELGGSIACDGFVSSIAGLFGCTPITSFSQNVGLASMSGVVNRSVIAVGAGIMILGGVFPAVGVVLTTIPQAVLGGVGILLYGMVTSVGIRTLVENRVDFSKSRNLAIASAILILGIGGATLTFGSFSLSSMALRSKIAR